MLTFFYVFQQFIIFNSYPLDFFEKWKKSQLGSVWVSDNSVIMSQRPIKLIIWFYIRILLTGKTFKGHDLYIQSIKRTYI